jgi:TetR/AcrR family transcriptional regulator, transcriptional repressor for nem operon
LTLLDDRSNIYIMNQPSTKEKLLQAGKAIFLEKGYNHTGLQEIVRAAGVPKGSFYHFFASKEAFGLAVLEQHMQTFCPFLDQQLTQNREAPPLQRLRSFFETGHALLEREGWKGGCIVGNFAQELADQNEVFREHLNNALNRWQKMFTGCLREAQESGDLPPEVDLDSLGQFLMNAWEGAILRTKVTKTGGPLKNFIAVYFDRVLPV